MAVEILEIRANTDDLRSKLNQVDKDLNETKESAKQTGDTISNSFGKSGQSLQKAQSNLSRITATIKEQEKITNEFRRELIILERQYSEVGKSGTDAGRKIKAEMDKLRLSIKDQTQSVRELKSQQSDQKRVVSNLQAQNKQTSLLSKGMSRLGPIIATAFAADKIKDFIVESVKLAEVSRDVEKAFNRIDGANIEELRRATQNTVSDLRLMQASVQAQNLGVPIRDMADLLGFAAQRAAETGQSVDHLTESIVTGIGRKSPRILDNLGISAVQLREALGEVSVESASVAQVSEAVGKIISENTDPAFQAAGKASERFAASIENLKVAIGEELLPVTDSLQNSLADLAGSAATVISSESLSGWEKFSAILSGLVSPAGNVNLTLAATRARVSELRKEMPELTEAMRDFDDFLTELRKDLGLDKVEPTSLIEGLKATIKEYDTQIEKATSVDEILRLNALRLQEINKLKRIETKLSEQEEAYQLRINTQIAARKNLLKNLQDDGVDPELEDSVTFPKDPFGTGETDLFPADEAGFEEAYEAELAAQLDFYNKKRENDIDYADFKKELDQQTYSAYADLLTASFELAATLAGENAEAQKAFASFQAIIQAYLAIQNTLASVPYPANVIAAAAIGVQAFANVVKIQTQEPPKMFEGTPYLHLMGNKKGKDTIPIMAHEGEAIIPASENAKYPGLAKAWIEGDLDKYITVKMLAPKLKKIQMEHDVQKELMLANQMGGSFHATLNDGRIVHELREQRYALEEVVENTRRNRRINPYRA